MDVPVALGRSEVIPQGLRADAQLNYRRLIVAAGLVFDRDGCDASMRSIAEEAGVGIGTLYRHFPNRARLVEAAYHSRVVAVSDTVEDIAAIWGPDEAFAVWAMGLIEFLVDTRGMVEALGSTLSDDSQFKTSTSKLLTRSVDLLLDAGQRDGLFRRDVDAIDVLRGIAGIAYVVEDLRQAQRLIALLRDGLRYSGHRDSL